MSVDPGRHHCSIAVLQQLKLLSVLLLLQIAGAGDLS
jgi:hypothetical protein